MRKLLLVLLVGAAIIWMFKHPDELQTRSKDVFAKLSGYFGRLAGEEKPSGASASGVNGVTPSAEIAVSEPQEMPDGIYCLTQPVRFTFANGSTVRTAGAMVRKTGEGGNGKMLVTDEVGTAVVDASLLTRDPVMVARLSQEAAAVEQNRDSANQTASKQTLAELDAKLASLRAELLSIQRRDLEASRKGRKIRFATTEEFVRSTMATLEKRRAEILATQKPVAPPPAP
jgi:hypothetical protein